jgi:acetyl esterase/lipase
MKVLSTLPALPIPKTCIYKTVREIEIHIDIYVPTEADGAHPPIMLFIHGGGWSGGNKTDYSRPLFHHFLSLGFIVTSMDYRLLPETKLKGQMEDIRDVEGWLRNSLAREVKDYFSGVQSDKIIVVGASAGAHLALLTVSIKLILHFTVAKPTISPSFGPYSPQQSCPCTDLQT